MSYNFKGKNVVITGGVSGIGLETVRNFKKAEATVIVLDKNAEEGKIQSSKEGFSFYACRVDVYDEVEKAFSQIRKDFGAIDVLILNAGISIRHRFSEITVEDWNKVINTNLNGVFYGLKAGIPVLRNNEGVVLMTASTNGIMGYPYYADYNASKAGVISLAKSLSLELAPKIRINAICPGYVMTPMQRAEYTDEMLEQVNSKIPLKRHADPAEIARLFMYLSSDDARFITGQQFIIDGGEIAGGLASR